MISSDLTADVRSFAELNQEYRPTLERMETISNALLRACCVVLGVKETASRVANLLDTIHNPALKQGGTNESLIEERDAARTTLENLAEHPPGFKTTQGEEAYFNSAVFKAAIEGASDTRTLLFNLEFERPERISDRIGELREELEELRLKLLTHGFDERIDEADRVIILDDNHKQLSGARLPERSQRETLNFTLSHIQAEAERVFFALAEHRQAEEFAEGVYDYFRKEYRDSTNSCMGPLNEEELNEGDLNLLRLSGSEYLRIALEECKQKGIEVEGLGQAANILLDTMLLSSTACRLSEEVLQLKVSELQDRI